MGSTVLIALGVIASIAIMCKESVDAVVLDFNVPRTNGNQIAEAITREQPTVPVVICGDYLDKITEFSEWFADGPRNRTAKHLKDRRTPSFTSFRNTK